LSFTNPPQYNLSMPIQPCQQPFIVRNLLSKEMLENIKRTFLILKESEHTPVDDVTYKRKFAQNVEAFKIVQYKYINKIANEYFAEPLKPSYVFASLYHKSEGYCQYHVDRPQCYRTIDCCIDQNEPWPLYIAHQDTDPTYDSRHYLEKEDYYRSLGKEYIMEPGDAVFYSGTQFPHWRNKIQKDNFCDLLFFHFVPTDFTGSLN
jgi:hypothetical protein